MRPDEHKRRKNENYKKKHNIPAGKTKENDPKQKVKTADAKDPKRTAQEKPAQRLNVTDQTTDPGDEVNTPRRLTDNWDRYEEIEEEERFEPEMRGEDFNKLIAESGGSSSRFRFKDEEGWTDEAADPGGSSQGLAIDFDQLAQAISCIPLHERLSLTKDLFTDEQLEEMSKSADECQKRYDKTYMDLEKETKNTYKSRQTKAKDKPTTLKDTDAKNTVPLSQSVETSAKVNDTNINSQTKPVDKRLPDDLNSLEDDLDSLLSADTPSLRSTKVHKPTSPKPTVTKDPVIQSNGIAKKEASTEDWLDELLGD